MIVSSKGELLATGSLNIGELLEEFDERLGSRVEPEILTLTEKMGFVAQRERFNKRLAIQDTSDYKVIGLNDIAFNPYLLWANAIAQNTRWKIAIISPLYPTFRVRKGYSARFVNYLLCSGFLRSRYDAISFGSVPRKRRSSVEDFLALQIHMSVPPLAEQERIVKLLDEADELRKLRNKADSCTAALISALFHEMFGDPATNSHGWPGITLGDIGGKGQYGLNAAAITEGTGVRFIRITDIDEFGCLGRCEPAFVPASIGDLSVYTLEEGDILIARTGATAGKAYVHTPLWERSVFAGYLIRFTIDRARALPIFVFAFLQTAAYWHQLNSYKRAVAQPNVNAKQLASLRLFLPPLVLQKEFADRVEEIRAMQAEQIASRARLEEFFQSMLYRAFNGEL